MRSDAELRSLLARVHTLAVARERAGMPVVQERRLLSEHRRALGVD